MIAVCGIGSPKGLRNKATTAYQSASPPMVAASAKAATKPNAGCSGSNALAAMKIANVATSTSVASSLTRRSSAARCASAGVSTTNVPGTVMEAFGGKRSLAFHTLRVPDAVQRLLALLRRAGTHNRYRYGWTPDQQRTTPQARRAAQHPGNARPSSQKESPPKRAFQNGSWQIAI